VCRERETFFSARAQALAHMDTRLCTHAFRTFICVAVSPSWDGQVFLALLRTDTYVVHFISLGKSLCGCVCVSLRGGIYSAAAPVARAIGRSPTHVAAGVTWTLVVANAPWAARDSHTSVIDAGAIYVIGGKKSYGDDKAARFNDVYVSTNGGAYSGAIAGYSRGTQRVLAGY
jgi:hypothetical protein